MQRTGTKAKTTGVSFTDEERSHLKALADSYGVNPSRLVNMAIDVFPTLDRMARESSAREKLRRDIVAVDSMVRRRDAGMVSLASLFGKLRSENKIDAETFQAVYNVLGAYGTAEDQKTMEILSTLPLRVADLSFPTNYEEREAEAHRVLEEMLGLELSNRLADLCMAWGATIQETLKAAIEHMPTQEERRQFVKTMNEVKRIIKENPEGAKLIGEISKTGGRLVSVGKN